MPTTAATQHTCLILFWHYTYSKLTSATYTGNQKLLTRALRLDLRCKPYSPLRRPSVTLCVTGRPLLEVRRMRSLAQLKNATRKPNMVH